MIKFADQERALAEEAPTAQEEDSGPCHPTRHDAGPRGESSQRDGVIYAKDGAFGAEQC